MGDRDGVAPRPDPLPLPVVDNHTHLDIRRRDVADAIAPDGGEERTTQDVAAALATAVWGDGPQAPRGATSVTWGTSMHGPR